MLNLYPYTDFHELNLDMILRMMKDLHKEWTDFEAVNKITNAGAWDITKQYQAWTVVSDNNIGYISLKPVPSGVAITNIEYWGVIADYNIFITDLSNRISVLEAQMATLNNTTIPAINSNITNLRNQCKKRKFLLIGDSLGMGTSFVTGQGYSDGKGWVGWCMDMIGTDNCVWAAIDGGGFTEPIPYQWQYQLENVNLGTHTVDEFTDLVILGGSNDMDDTTANIKTAISNLVTYARTTYPNLNRIAVGCLAEPQHIEKIRERYLQCIEFGCEYISCLENLLCDAGLYDDTKHTHLSQFGYQYYSPWICEAVVFGHADYHFKFTKPLSIHNKIPSWVSLLTGYQQAYIQYDISAEEVEITLLPASSYPAAYNQGDVTFYKLTGWGYPAGAHPTILSCGPNPVLYDDTDSIYCIGFLGDAAGRSVYATPLIDASTYKEIGYANFSFFDYRIDYWGGTNPYKFTINLNPTFYDTSQGTGAGALIFAVGSTCKCSVHRS